MAKTVLFKIYPHLCLGSQGFLLRSLIPRPLPLRRKEPGNEAIPPHINNNHPPTQPYLDSIRGAMWVRDLATLKRTLATGSCASVNTTGSMDVWITSGVHTSTSTWSTGHIITAHTHTCTHTHTHTRRHACARAHTNTHTHTFWPRISTPDLHWQRRGWSFDGGS